ncbi:MAG: hypothetical protein JXA42_00070, partial [Anaerolineales bacterium]|nr:hypothetical protein [Anaerolineales bacterium]
MSRLIGIAAVQMSAVPHNIPATLDKMETLVAQIARSLPWVDMLCFPEFMLDAAAPYIPTPNRAAIESIPGPITNRLCALASHHQKWLVP